MALYEFWTSRNNAVANTAAYVGQIGRLFYDNTDGILKISDGSTPGGVRITYPVATSSIVGGIKAGPGANVSTDGTLTINTAGLPLGIGNLFVVDNVLSSVNANADVILQSNGTGNVELVGNVAFYNTTQGHTGTPYFQANQDGQITILVPASDPTAGAVKIIGSQTGRFSPPINTGVILQVTGNNNDASRIYNDSIGSFAAFVGRRINGNVLVPTAVQAGDEIIRISSTGHNGNTIPGAGSARILYQAKETYTTSAQGSNLSIWTTAVGTTTLVKTATFDRETGLTVSGNLAVGNIAVDASGTITTPRIVFNDGGIRSISDGTSATIDFSVDSMVLWYIPSGTATVTLSNYRAGTTVRLHIRIGNTSRDINYGVAAGDNSSTGATSFNGSGFGSTDISNTTMQLVYTCYDGTAANTYVAVTTI